MGVTRLPGKWRYWRLAGSVIRSKEVAVVVSRMPMVIIFLRPDGIAMRRTAGEVEMGDVRATEHLHHGDSSFL
jgi:hypothetical protein